MFFGDFWQLEPPGGKSFMSNPCDITGDPFVDLTVPMFWLPARTYPEDVSENPQSSTAKNNEALETFEAFEIFDTLENLL